MVPHKVGKGIAFMPPDKFFDYLGHVEKDLIWWSFEIKDLFGGLPGDIYIWTKDEYTIFINMLSRLKMKRKVFIRLANAKEDRKKEYS